MVERRQVLLLAAAMAGGIAGPSGTAWAADTPTGARDAAAGGAVAHDGGRAGPFRIGVTAGPLADILTQVVAVAATQGLALCSVVRADGHGINADVAAGRLDVAAFQDAVAFAAEQSAPRPRHGPPLANVGRTVTLPVAVYSRTLRTLHALGDGDRIAVPSEPAALSRALVLLHNFGILTLRDGSGLRAGLADVVDRRRRERLQPVPAARLAAQLDRCACAVIDSAHAAAAGWLPGRDAIGIEDARSPWSGMLAVRAGDAARPWVAALVAAYHDEAIKRYVFGPLAGLGATPLVSTVSFACTACGKCCDSPPAMTVAELFDHEDLFVGCLAVHRVPRFRAGDTPGADPAAAPLSADDADALGALAERLHHRVDPRDASSPRFALRTQGHDHPSLGACPARADDGRCRLHGAGKPATCAVVPLDAQWPDRLQHVVLHRRLADSAYIGAECLVAGPDAIRPALLVDRHVVDPADRARMAQQRDALADDRAAWGDAVAALLRRTLFAGRDGVRALPATGYLSLPLVPVLQVLADRSPAWAERCERYAERQTALIDANIARALERRQPGDRPFTQELRRWAQAYRQLCQARPTGARRLADGSVPAPTG